MRKRHPEAGFSELDLLFNPWFWAVVAVIVAGSALVYPFLTSVDRGEIVVKDCGGDLTVWKYPKDEGVHWDGLCRTETYFAIDSVSFKEPIVVDGVRYVVRGTATFDLIDFDDDQVKALHRTYGSEAGVSNKVLGQVRIALQGAAADPGWAEPKGNIVERKLKGALEYSLKRVSPTGAIWTAPETRQALEREVNRRLIALSGTDDPSLEPTVTLGFTTER